MRGQTIFRSILIAAMALATRIVAFPAAAARGAYNLFVGGFETLANATDVSFVRDLFGSPALIPSPAGTPIDMALAHDQRYEAGLARMGAVRHV